MLITIFIFIVTSIYCGIVIWFLIGFNRKQTYTNTKTDFISVIVAAHNEEKNIGRCLHALTRQAYPANLFEIIVVDDRSTDGTADVVASFAETHPQVMLHRIHATPPDMPAKKHALNAGIQQARGAILCFTDADCRPGEFWLKNIMRTFAQDTGMAVGFTHLIPAQKEKPPLWQRFVAYDSWITGFVSLSSISNHFPLTCGGGNLAYRKKTFLTVSGFSSIAQSLSGDDDLLMHLFTKISGQKIIALKAPDSVVVSETVASLRQLYQQKTRHFSAGKYYPLSKKLFYFFWQGSSLLLTVFPIAALCSQSIALQSTVFALLIKWSVDILFHFSGFRKYKMAILLKYFLLYQIVYPFYYLLLGLAGRIKKPVWQIKS